MDLSEVDIARCHPFQANARYLHDRAGESRRDPDEALQIGDGSRRREHDEGGAEHGDPLRGAEAPAAPTFEPPRQHPHEEQDDAHGADVQRDTEDAVPAHEQRAGE
jgi:hypothetical protein